MTTEIDNLIHQHEQAIIAIKQNLAYDIAKVLGGDVNALLVRLLEQEPETKKIRINANNIAKQLASIINKLEEREV